jgi:formylglycine-generating enzyme required for sulfatase activity
MPWPSSQDYNEAVQHPASCFADDDLRAGEAVTNALGLPLPCSGNFADVYHLRCPGGEWAVKCFTRQVVGLHQRYAAVSEHLGQARLSFAVPFQYLDQGIQVHGAWYPVVKMRWVEGLTLNEFVRNALDRPALLDALGQLWLRMARRLRECRMAHGDLQHGNVLLVPAKGGESLHLRLIDYDGMWVPALAAVKSGEVGHPNYQHPQRLREGTYSQEVDRFALLLVATALRCLQVGGRALWERYDNGDNLLFKEADFAFPHQSPLFAELLRLPDPAARSIAARLMAAAQKPLEQTPLLEEVLSDNQAEQAVPLHLHKTASAPGPSAAQQRSNLDPRATNQDLEKQFFGPLPTEPWWEAQAEAEAPEQSFAPPQSDTDRVRRHIRRRRVQRIITSSWLAVVLLVLVGVIVLVANPGGGDSTKGSASGGVKPAPPLEPALSKAFTNSLGMEFVLVPKGKSWLGGSGGKPGDRMIDLAYDFYLGKYEVTQEEWQKVMGSNPSFCKAGAGVTEEDVKRCPVEQVSWDDAQLFLSSVNKRDRGHGWAYRLPTEVEWEYACRGGPMTDRSESAFDYYLDKPTNQLRLEQANFEPSQGLKRTCKVGSYKPNRLGLYDMHGNVDEWCSDVERPGVAGSPRMHRGGSWGSTPAQCRAVDGGGCPPSVVHSMVGLRLARVPAVKMVAGQLEVIEDVRRFRGHTADTYDVAFSPDGLLAASGAVDKTARVWDVKTGTELHKLEGYTAHVECVCFSPDSRRLAAGSGDSTLRLWDVASGKEIGRFEGHPKGVQYPLMFAPDGKRLISHGEDKVVRVWDVETRKQLRQFEYRNGLSLDIGLWVSAFSRDGRLALTGATENKVRLWDVEKGQNLGELDFPAIGGTISPDSRFALCGFEANNREFRLYDLEKPQSNMPFRRFEPAPEPAHQLVFFPDGQRVLAKYVAGDLGVWDVASGRETHHFATRCTGRVAISPDGHYALGGLCDGSLQLWRLPD